jgi:NADPH:quinone reductase-like Zn-dependent oxidoreductase
MPTSLPSVFDVTGKVALITGASSGLGRHFAEVLAQAGAKVGLAARRIDTLQSVADASVRQEVPRRLPDSTLRRKLLWMKPPPASKRRSGHRYPGQQLRRIADEKSARTAESDWDAVIDVNLSSAQLALERTTIRHNPSSR